jgi:hypothetical protein
MENKFSVLMTDIAKVKRILVVEDGRILTVRYTGLCQVERFRHLAWERVIVSPQLRVGLVKIQRLLLDRSRLWKHVS